MKNLTLFLFVLLFSETTANAYSSAASKVASSTARNAASLIIKKTDSLGVKSAEGLKDVLSFPIGAAVKVKLLRNNPVYRNLIIQQFNSITAENAMKFGALHPKADEYRWNDADFIVNFAKENNIRVHGHTLIWSKFNPDWVTKFQGTRADWENLLKTHVQAVVSHFKGKVASWDVVNEAIDDQGNFKKCIWLDKLGPSYIESAFRYAHECDPNALLFYNDYGQEFGGKKLKAIVDMAKDFKRRGVPLDGLGIQMHTVVRISDDKIARALNSVVALGLKVHVSELEVSVRNQKPASFLMDKDLAMQQAQKYSVIFEAYNSIPKSQQFGITTWNVADADSFRNAKIKNHDFPLLFDLNYQPKEAYELLMQKMRRK
jgi:endo-1,4-beta-xylanase